MGTLFELNRRNKFDLGSAREMLNLVYKITAEVDEQFQTIMSQIAISKNISDVEKTSELEAEAQKLIQRWEGKISKIGLEPKGIWLVDFDTGDGYFCWKYPEMDIKFWHGYEDGFSGRKPIPSSTNPEIFS